MNIGCECWVYHYSYKTEDGRQGGGIARVNDPILCGSDYGNFLDDVSKAHRLDRDKMIVSSLTFLHHDTEKPPFGRS